MEMRKQIHPFAINNEIIDNSTIEDTGLINTEAEINATQKLYATEFSQNKLNGIHRHLWFAGHKGKIHALHYQKILCREIILSECSDLHLVWFDRIIYIQPLPIGLLNYNFINVVVLPNEDLYCNILGFLYYYAMLIQHASDLFIAHELGLVSRKVEWKPWREFRKAFLENISSKRLPRTLMNKRFEYGELRLTRLNYIYRLSFRGLTYFTIHREYATYFREYTAAGITLFAFATVALTAMQVVVGMDGVSQALIETSYRFSILILFIIAIFSAVVLSIFAILFLFNSILAIRTVFRSSFE